jgi:hypothetical protein
MLEVKLLLLPEAGKRVILITVPLGIWLAERASGAAQVMAALCTEVGWVWTPRLTVTEVPLVLLVSFQLNWQTQLEVELVLLLLEEPQSEVRSPEEVLVSM